MKRAAADIAIRGRAACLLVLLLVHVGSWSVWAGPGDALSTYRKQIRLVEKSERAFWDEFRTRQRDAYAARHQQH